jgi:hypothetical protein
MMRITPRQKKALEGLAQGKTYKQALLDAGYSLRVANQGRDGLFRAKNLKKYNIGGKEEIQQIIQKFVDLQEQCERKRDYTNALRAMENLARINGMFVEKREIKAEIKQNSPFIDEIDKIVQRHS